MCNPNSELSRRLAFTMFPIGLYSAVYNAFTTINPLGAANPSIYIDRTEILLALHREHIIGCVHTLSEQELILQEIVQRSFTPAEIALGSVTDEAIELIASMIANNKGVFTGQASQANH